MRHNRGGGEDMTYYSLPVRHFWETCLPVGVARPVPCPPRDLRLCATVLCVQHGETVFNL